MKRRDFLFLSGVAVGVSALPLGGAFAADAAPAKLRIGFQKTSALLITKAQKRLEKRFEPRGIAVEWVEFTFGPPLLEALQAGAIDYGYTGDAPPIFAQAARAELYYVAVIPARGEGQAIIVPPESPIKTLADLKGKRIGVAKGSSAHNLLVASLESAKIAWGDVEVAYLAPADAAAAYTRGAIDAWSIWDPFYAIAELGARGARALPVDPAVSAQNSYFLANRTFTNKYPEIVQAVNEEVAASTAWAGAHRDEVAALFAEASGVAPAAQKKAVDRAEFTFGPLTDAVIAQQQAVADRFHRTGLIPKPIVVRDIVWTGKAS